MKTLRVVLSATLLAITLSAQQQSPGPLNDQRIADLVAMGVSQQEILRIIATAPKIDFDLRPVSTDALLKLGVSEDVIKAMAARESGAPVESHPVRALPPPPTKAASVPPMAHATEMTRLNVASVAP